MLRGLNLSILRLFSQDLQKIESFESFRAFQRFRRKNHKKIEASRGFGLWELRPLRDVVLTGCSCVSNNVSTAYLEGKSWNPEILVLDVVFLYMEAFYCQILHEPNILQPRNWAFWNLLFFISSF